MTMKLVEIAVCPLTGESGVIKVDSVADAFFDTEGNWQYRENTRTGHLWLNPRPAPDQIAELYKNYYTHAEPSSATLSIWQQAQALALSRRLSYPGPQTVGWLARLVSVLPSVGDASEMEMMRVPASRTGSLLDVGCGSGAFLKRMQQAGWQVMGTEPDPNAAARLRDRLQVSVFSSVEEVRLRADRFDLITLSHVIEHVPDPIATLRELVGLLAPGGQLMLTTPNARSLGSKLFGSSWRGLEPPRHFNIFSPKSMVETVESSGLRVDVLRTEVRLGRGIFYLSFLAKRGQRKLEMGQRAQNRVLTIGGYVFQVLEAMLIRVFPSLGEEIYCSAVARTHAAPPGN